MSGVPSFGRALALLALVWAGVGWGPGPAGEAQAQPVGPAGAIDAPRNVLAALEQAGSVACQPLLPFFCANIHVSCAGRSTLATFAFTLRATETHGSIESAADTAGMQEQYADGRVEWSRAEGYVIVRPREGNGYVKLLADGSYIFRHYSQYAATMSIGRCR